MDGSERGYTVSVADIVAVNGAALIAVALFVRIAFVALAGF